MRSIMRTVGGAGGYSIRIIGHQDRSTPVITHVQLWTDTLVKVMEVETHNIAAIKDELKNRVNADDFDWLSQHLHAAYKQRPLK